MWFVRQLYNHRVALSVNLAPAEVSKSWAVEEIFYDKPLGVYHLMRSMEPEKREKVLKFCPEAKRMFRICDHVR